MSLRLPRMSAVFAALCALTAARAGSSVSAAEHGRLTEFEGLPVLELWGTRAEMAFAHGYLLADRIVPLLDDFMLSSAVLPDIAVYHAVILPSIRVRWDWTPYEAEMEALFAGVLKKLGPAGLISRKLDRAITVDDLMACNAIPDWHGLFCSSFTAWGEMTADGQTITARNLDYDFTPEMAKAQLLVVQHGGFVQPGGSAQPGEPERQPFVSVTWPGLVGVFTGVNAEGVSVLSHDANSLPKTGVTGFTPRGLIFREALEKAHAITAFDDAATVFRSHRVICGNNQHVSVPSRPGETPARIFEYDAATSVSEGLTVRSDSGHSGLLAQAIYCTNHVRLRQSPELCERFSKLERALKGVGAGGKKLDWKLALETVRTAAANNTLHTVVVEPNKGMLHILIPSLKAAPVTVPFAEWLRRAPGKLAARD